MSMLSSQSRSDEWLKKDGVSKTKMGIGQFMLVCTSVTTAIDATVSTQ